MSIYGDKALFDCIKAYNNAPMPSFNNPEQEKQKRKNNKGLFGSILEYPKELWNGLQEGNLGMLQGIASFVGAPDVAEDLAKRAEKYSSGYNGDVSVDWAKNPGGFTHGVGSFIGSGIPGMVFGGPVSLASKGPVATKIAMNVGKAANIFGRTKVLSKPAKKIANVMLSPQGEEIIANRFGGLVSGAMEAASEGGSAYDRALEKGYDKDTARKMARNTFAANMFLTPVSNTVELGFAKGLINGRKNGLKKSTLEVLKNAGIQGFEEGMQQNISNAATKDNPFFNLSHDEVQSALVGAITTGVMGGTGKVISHAAHGISNNKNTNQKSNVVSQQKSDLDNLKIAIGNVESRGSGGYTAEHPKTKAYGRYQFLPSTYRDVAKSIGIDPNDKSPAAQDKVFYAHAADLYKKGGVEGVIRGWNPGGGDAYYNSVKKEFDKLKNSNGHFNTIEGIAKKYLGTPYVYGGTSTKGFDCSGFVQYVYKEAGINLERSSDSQRGQIKEQGGLTGTDFTNIPVNALLFKYGSGKNGHVAIYLGNGKIIEAVGQSGGNKVKISENLTPEKLAKRFNSWGLPKGAEKLSNAPKDYQEAIEYLNEQSVSQDDEESNLRIKEILDKGLPREKYSTAVAFGFKPFEDDIFNDEAEKEVEFEGGGGGGGENDPPIDSIVQGQNANSPMRNSAKPKIDLPTIDEMQARKGKKKSFIDDFGGAGAGVLDVLRKQQQQKDYLKKMQPEYDALKKLGEEYNKQKEAALQQQNLILQQQKQQQENARLADLAIKKANAVEKESNFRNPSNSLQVAKEAAALGDDVKLPLSEAEKEVLFNAHKKNMDLEQYKEYLQNLISNMDKQRSDSGFNADTRIKAMGELKHIDSTMEKINKYHSASDLGEVQSSLKKVIPEVKVNSGIDKLKYSNTNTQFPNGQQYKIVGKQGDSLNVTNGKRQFKTKITPRIQRLVDKALNDDKMLDIARKSLEKEPNSVRAMNNIHPAVRDALIEKVTGKPDNQVENNKPKAIVEEVKEKGSEIGEPTDYEKYLKKYLGKEDEKSEEEQEASDNSNSGSDNTSAKETAKEDKAIENKKDEVQESKARKNENKKLSSKEVEDKVSDRIADELLKDKDVVEKAKKILALKPYRNGRDYSGLDNYLKSVLQEHDNFIDTLKKDSELAFYLKDDFKMSAPIKIKAKHKFSEAVKQMLENEESDAGQEKLDSEEKVENKDNDDNYRHEVDVIDKQLSPEGKEVFNFCLEKMNEEIGFKDFKHLSEKAKEAAALLIAYRSETFAEIVNQINPNETFSPMDYVNKDDRQRMFFHSLEVEIGKSGYFNKTFRLLNGKIDFEKTLHENKSLTLKDVESVDATLFHELGHMFASDLVTLASSDNCPSFIKKDFETLANWVNTEKQTSDNINPTTYIKEHGKKYNEEMFAVAFSRYVAEGKTPIKSINNIFKIICKKVATCLDSFKKNILDVLLSDSYSSFYKKKPAQYLENGPIPKEIYEIMDRFFYIADKTKLQKEELKNVNTDDAAGISDGDRGNGSNQLEGSVSGQERGREDGSGIQQADQNNETQSGISVSGHRTASGGKNSSGRNESEVSSADTDTSGGSELSGSVRDSYEGQSIYDGGRGEDVSTAAEDRCIDEAVKQGEIKLEKQKKADDKKTSFKAADEKNIRESLPSLFKEQQEDVIKAEKRLLKEKKTGMLFTNGTGTGKTFTGLGFVKRMVMQGKGNILIVTPSDKLCKDWIESGEKLNLDVTQLINTKDSGQGVVVTTFANMGSNTALVNRDWDAVIIDESHRLMEGQQSNPTKALHCLRALTYHARGFFERFKRMNPKEYKEDERLKSKREELNANYTQAKNGAEKEELKKEIDKIDEEREALWKKLEPLRKEKVIEWEKIKSEDKPKTIFLSATPFAYVKNLDYAEGYLFDYDKSKVGGNYNEANGENDFFIKNFGYRMKNNKLTRPDAEVNSGVMERQFHEKLKKEGAISGRRLVLDKDYQRGFLVTENKLGALIDDGFKWLNEAEGGRFRALAEIIRNNFGYIDKQYLLEAMKADSAIKYAKEYIKQGKKVVVFHGYNKGGSKNPFIIDSRAFDDENSKLKLLYHEFLQKRPDLAKLKVSLPSPIEAFKAAFGDDVLLYNGKVNNADKESNVKKFNDDNSGKDIILIQQDAGKEGISLHDTTGKHQRVLINLGMPTKPTAAIQIEGRIYRVGQMSNAIIRYLSTGTAFEMSTFANTISQRVATSENLALGEEARGLKQAFVEAYETTLDGSWKDFLPGAEGEGIGGKEKDRLDNNPTSEFEKAKTFYYGNQKKNSRNKSAEGKDYFATPEPLGLKMVEWADIKSGEKVLEPSAGHGAISRWFSSITNNYIIEPSRELASRAKLVTEGTVIEDVFENYNTINKFNAIVMNPPFGTAGKTAMEHVAKAFKHLRDNGRIVALVPEGSSMQNRLDKWLESDESKDAAVVANIRLPNCVFERAGTKVGSKIVIIDKYSNEEKRLSVSERNIDLTYVEDINELFDKIEHLTMPGREGMEVNQTAQKPAAGELVANSNNGHFILGEHLHTKTGEIQYKAKIEEKISTDNYKKIAAVAKKNGGYWSRFAKAFLFKSEEGRSKFTEEANKLFDRGDIKYSIKNTENGLSLEGIPERDAELRKKGYTRSERIDIMVDELQGDSEGFEFHVPGYARNNEKFNDVGLEKLKSRLKGYLSRGVSAETIKKQLFMKYNQDKNYGNDIQEAVMESGYVKGVLYHVDKILRELQENEMAGPVETSKGRNDAGGVGDTYGQFLNGSPSWHREHKRGVLISNRLGKSEDRKNSIDSRDLKPKTGAEWLNTLKEVFPSAERIVREGNTFSISLPNNNRIKVNIGEKIEFTVEDRKRAELALGRKLKLGERPAGSYVTTVDLEGLISLADEADDFTINHEAFHAVKALALSDKQIAKLNKFFENNEEKQADAFAQWKKDHSKFEGTIFNTIFKRIVSFCRNLKYMFGAGSEVEDIFKKIADGTAWMQEASKPNKPSISDVKYSLYSDLKDLAHKLGRKENERITVKETDTKKGNISPLEKWFVSAHNIKGSKIMQYLCEKATTAKEVQEKLRAVWHKSMDEVDQLLNKDEFKKLSEIMFTGDMEQKEFTEQELSEMGANDNMIEAYHKIRGLMKEIYEKINETRQQVKYKREYVTAEKLKELQNNKFVKILKITEKEDGTVVGWKEIPSYEKKVVMTKEALELSANEEEENIQIISAKQLPDGTYGVKLRECTPKLNELTGYLPHFFHQFSVRDAETGKIFTTANSIREAYKLAESILKDNPEMNLSIQPKTFSFTNAEDEKNMAVVVGDMDYSKMMSKIAKNTDMTIKEVQEALRGDIKRTARHRFYGNMLHRTGASGYEQDLEWVLRHHINMSSRYVALEKFKPDAINAFERTFGRWDRDWAADSDARIVKTYIQGVNGDISNAEKKANDFLNNSFLGNLIKNTLGVGNSYGERSALRVIQNTQGWIATAKLGCFNVGSALINFTQLINAVGLMGARATSRGLSIVTKAEGINGYTLLKSLGQEEGKGYSDIDMQVLEETGVLYDLGLNSTGYSRSRHGGKGKGKIPGLGFFVRNNMFFFEKAEALVRKVTVLGAYHKAISDGKTHQEAIQYAKEVNRDANFDYSVADNPLIFTKWRGSVLGDAILMFQKYPVKELEVMCKIAKEAGLKRNAEFWAGFLGLAGLGGMPFLGVAGSILNSLIGLFSGDDEDLGLDIKKKLMEWASEGVLPKPVVKTILYGVLSNIGIDISSRVGMGDILNNDESVLAAATGVFGSTISGLYKASQNRDIVSGFKAVSPAIGNMLQAGMGYSVDSKGRLAYRYDTVWDKVQKGIGFRDVEESIAYDKQRIYYKTRDEVREKKKEVVQDYLENRTPANKKKVFALGVTSSELRRALKKQKNDNAQRAKDKQQRFEDRLSKKDKKEFENILSF